MLANPVVLAVIQAGGQGSRLDVLTRERAKPALSFAGSFQLIDVALTNCAHSGISDVWLSVQYQAGSLHHHLAAGRPWDLDRTRGGLRWLMPEEGGGSAAQDGFSNGNGDDLHRFADAIRAFAPDVVVVMSTDQVLALDLRPVVAAHLERGSHCTLVTTEVSRTQAAEKAVVTVGQASRVTAIDYKPERPDGHDDRRGGVRLRARCAARHPRGPAPRAVAHRRRAHRHRRLRRAPPSPDGPRRGGARVAARGLLGRPRHPRRVPVGAPRPAGRAGRRADPPGVAAAHPVARAAGLPGRHGRRARGRRAERGVPRPGDGAAQRARPGGRHRARRGRRGCRAAGRGARRPGCAGRDVDPRRGGSCRGRGTRGGGDQGDPGP